MRGAAGRASCPASSRPISTTAAVIAMATKTMAAMRARTDPSMDPSPSVVEHPGIAGLVARTRGEEALALDPALFGCRGPLGLDQRGCAAIGGDDGDQIGDLLGLQRQKLVARLGRLQ